MSQSPSAIQNWLDRDFFELGSFLTSADGESVIFGKGGSYTLVDRFYETDAPVFYLKDFFQNSYLAYLPKAYLKVSKASVMAYLNSVTLSPEDFSPVENDDELYQKDFTLLKSAFNQELEKVVLVSRESYESFEGPTTISYLLNKAMRFGTGLPYGFWHGHYGMIGSTPELLYQADKELLKTFALAGTAKEGQETELLNSAKDRHEHNLVIKDISEKLLPFTSEQVIHETGIHHYKNIIHLKTDIESKALPGIDLTNLTNALSPTAALGGYPKGTSLKFLQCSKYYQKYPNRYFGSAFGLITPDWTEGQHLFIESGGGVVKESEFSKELEEIHMKRNTIRKHYL
jgi:isochorismate synthase EntC